MSDRGDTERRGRKKFTGYHATWMFVAFFGVIAAVNFTMARFAISSFGGTVVDNSYVASQKYNDWLAKAEVQDAYGWNVGKPARQGGRLQIDLSDKNGAALTDAQIKVLADHPVGRTDPFTLTMQEGTAGTYQSREDLPAGRWKLKIHVQKDGRDHVTLGEVK
ncbi:FixH family protein [Sphingorhabdus sp. Alg239-R122]|uniref:FixH family protein n=1 Tax=Sphingorhabdus sp. Alg239-R122 TaxID=2305989 RepID=UPI0013D950C4|nr:FixH family protein [Sphingorhabdus sp. Alg239-R122]